MVLARKPVLNICIFTHSFSLYYTMCCTILCINCTSDKQNHLLARQTIDLYFFWGVGGRIDCDWVRDLMVLMHLGLN